METRSVYNLSGYPCQHRLHFVNSLTINMPGGADTEDRLKRIQNYQGVTGVLIINNEGIPVKTSMDNSTSVQYSNNLTNCVALARNVVRDLDPQDDLKFFRIRTKKNEIMLAPENGSVLTVIQSSTN